MPRFPGHGRNVDLMKGSLFSSLAHRISSLQGEVYPLHIGDTWMEPAEGARMEDIKVAAYPGMHRYASPAGHPMLVDTICAQRGLTPDRVLVTAGATGALAAAADALLNPGDEVLILSPFWPLIQGIVLAAGGVPVHVPFYDRPGSVAERIGPLLTERTAVLYVNTPNNPTGAILDRDTVAAIGAFAREHDLWLWSDEVYEDYAFTAPHEPVAPHAPERTLCAHSFSKAWGMAGNRVGFLTGPPQAIDEARKITTHCTYSVTTAGQIAAARVLRDGATWMEIARTRYELAGNAAADRLGLPRPQGGTFLFMDVAPWLDESGLLGFLERCLNHNLVLAPGTSCGDAYGTFVRICFTCAPPEVVARGVEVLAGLLGR